MASGSELWSNSTSIDNLSQSFSNFQLDTPNPAPVSFASTQRKLILMAKDQAGSQYLQSLLSSKNSRVTDMIFNAVYEFTLDLMVDQYGRFLFGKLIESCHQYQLQQITQHITSTPESFFKVSITRHGSHSIKRLIKVLARSQSVITTHLINCLTKLFKFIMCDKIASSVIMQCLESLDDVQNDPIYLVAIELFEQVSNDENGCVAMNNLIDDMRGTRRRQLLQLISNNAVCLSVNPHGNYVVQHVLALENPEWIEIICTALKGHYLDLCFLKGGSHVVEKCIKIDYKLHYVLEEFLNSNRLLQVAKDRYGNYVIQRALNKTMQVDTSLHRRLVIKFQPCDLNSLRYGYGKNVYNMILGSSRNRVPVTYPI